ncbi:leucyl aminopeptidase [Pseudactinotalea sp. HY158]|uniref:leucyl aminopeptidase n=1 Tax=Pseudactinotalea sp. HY158 TaxID=2654547 RepID=UPI00129CEC1B|nr:leucyl aminopeptidase [Pseudactinotalea sp. HY158]QGH69487.1 leucyl aminopeptidase [Pseudactinotalea sp. HY158]
MTNIDVTSKDPARVSADALVVAVAAGTTARLANAGMFAPAARAALEQAIAVLEVTGKADEVVRLPAPEPVAARLVAFTGLGDLAEAEEPSLESLRRAAGAATRALPGRDGAVLALPAHSPEQLGAVAEGALLGAYRVRPELEARGGKSRAASSEGTLPLGHVTVATPLKPKQTKDALARARVVAAAVHGTRDLVNTPPNVLFPESFADRARALVKGTGIKMTVVAGDDLRAGGYGGLVGVGQGSQRGPRLVKLSYTPAKPAAHYALVGKGITFDSGGLSIKPAAGMETMKSDMAGAAAVLHTVLAAAALGVGVRVTGWLALAENMPSGTAQRPSDVITIRGGTTVEVLNTDAEGRLVLADALVAAGEEDPDVVVDIATLTGAQMVALGNQVSAVMGTDDAREHVIAAADAAGEQMWPMPLPVALRASLDSAVADLANIGERFGGMLVAGLFLKEFTGSRPWAHLDIAGPSFNSGKPRHYEAEGGTGAGVRTLLTLLENAARRAA